MTTTLAVAQLVDPATIADKYIDEVPQPAMIAPALGQPGDFYVDGVPGYDIHATQIQQVVHQGWPATNFFAYDGATPGRTVVAMSGAPVILRFHNQLPAEYLFPIDHTLMGADRGLPDTRLSIHLHGGHVEAAHDGHPDSTFDPGTIKDYHYPNNQPAATLWYHDHTLGTTRTNAYAGMAAFYLIADPEWLSLIGNGLPDLNHLLGFALQDREFYDADKQLYYPELWEPEFFGRIPMINGKIFPKCTVDPAQYLCLWLGGSQARFWNLKLVECDAEGNTLEPEVPGPAWTVVASEQGLMPQPVVYNNPQDPNSERFLVAPGERWQVVMDFSEFRGRYLKLINNAPTPFTGNFTDSSDVPLPDVMVFAVRDVTPVVTAPVPPNLGTVTPPPTDTNTLQRNISLRELMDEMENPIVLLVNGMGFYDPLTELPRLGSTEIWAWVNTTGDVHPMHLHDIRFLPLDRRPFDVEHYLESGEIHYTGPAVPVDAREASWKDTWNCYPGYVNRVAGTFEDYTGIYMDHCHILEHEENEMMRPFMVMGSLYTDIGFQLTAPAMGCAPGDAQLDTLRLNTNRDGLPNLRLVIKLPAGIVLDAASANVEPAGAARDPNLLYATVTELGGDSILVHAVWSAPYSSNDPAFRFADIPLRYAGAPAGTYTLTGAHTVWIPHESNQRFVNELILGEDGLEVTDPCEFHLVVQPWNNTQDVRLTWTSFPGAAAYHVHYDSVVTGSFTDYVAVPAPDTSATLPAIDPQGKQFYRVVAVVPARAAQRDPADPAIKPESASESDR